MIEACAIVLAGGKSSRMGRDKTELPWQGTTMLEAILGLLAQNFSQVLLVGKKAPGRLAVMSLADETPGLGPLGGLVTGLKNTKYEWNFVLACDMPFLNMNFLRLLWEYRLSTHAVVPFFKDKWQPLCGLYHRDTLSLAEERLKQGQGSMQGFLTALGAYAVREQDWIAEGLDAKVFINLNTPEDYQVLQKNMD